MQNVNATILALETSGNSLGVALIDAGVVVFDENVTEGMIHGRALVPLMKKALQSRGVKPAQLGGVAVSVGPGSWTGLRIGISAAKALAWAAGVPLVCVPSFEALALEANERATRIPAGKDAGAPILTVRDARSEGFFAAIIRVTRGAPERLLEECVIRHAALVEAARRVASAGLVVCGDAKCVTTLGPEIAANGWTALRELEHIPALAVARCGWRRFQAGEGVLRTAVEIHKVGPLYLRASDPELKLGKTKVLSAES
ncbi:MAG TPA: tRNA (adenosine(37)-N6)-threonylcarbamoyltransferase complex dimerization subunit type 1 TsaB [Planctomycetota bacterium]|nr:tRNA (adenosine(37)-N6)-threonylcarbamoyltransferase complex dimerization subunit type 1 TsaB [Planctomycetota bacterium]